MKSRIKAFLQQAGIEMSDELVEKIITFFVSSNNRIIFNHGQLYFMHGGIISQLMAYSGHNDAIVEFNGKNITQIDNRYYLGENIKRDNIGSNNNNGNNG